jgi:hypothetical protein|tara:strand:- start:45 stop:674 length:630 start_codon:yes stop_codon:yes gene_type:complete
MAIGTFAQLKTAAANWLDRSDLTDRIPEFIALAEARFNRELRTRDMETVSTAISTVAGTREYSLPTGFVQMKEFHLSTDPLTPLAYITPEMMTRLWAGSATAKPQVFTIIADNVRLGPAPDAVYTTSMLYYKTFTALSDSATTNEMLTNNPDVYLYGTLLEAEPFIMNDQRIQVWLGAFDRAVASIQNQDNKDRHSGSNLRVMSASGTP